MTKIFGFSGKMGSGKDYTANLLSEYIFNFSDGSIAFMKFANSLRAELNSIMNDYKSGMSVDQLSIVYAADKNELTHLVKLFENDSEFINDNYSLYSRTPNSREILQYWGTDYRRKQDINYWINKTKSMIDEKSKKVDYIFLTDVRFPNELNLVKEFQGVSILCYVDEPIRLKRLDGRLETDTVLELNHISETALDDSKFNFKVDTNKECGLKDLIDHLKADNYL